MALFGDLQKRNRAIIGFSILSSAVFLLLFASYWGIGKVLSQAYHYVTYPIQNTVNSVSDNLALELDSLREINRLREELTDTRSKLIEVQGVMGELALVRKKNIELQALLGYQQSLSYTTIFSRIVAKDPQNLFPTLIADKGSHDGVIEGMPVLGFTKGISALVGNVIEVSEYSCRVQTIYDPRCQVSIMVETTSDIGLAKGRMPKDHRLLVEYVDRRSENLETRRVITSGLGDKYPKGIYVGQVSQADRKRYGLFQRLYLEPYINFFTLEDVFILVAARKSK